MADLICFHDPEDENPWFSNWYRSDFYLGGTTFTSMDVIIAIFSHMIFFS